MIYHGIFVIIYDWTYVALKAKKTKTGGRRTDKRLFASMYTLDVLSNFYFAYIFLYTFDPFTFYYHLVLVP